MNKDYYCCRPRAIAADSFAAVALILLVLLFSYRQGTSSQSIWLNPSSSSCSSSDSCLAECDTCPVSSVSICVHSEDVTLECSELISD